MKGRLVSTIQKEAPLAGGFPIIGKVKVGMKGANGYPTSLDYFLPDGKYASLFNQAYGDKPSSLTAVFMSDDISQVCNMRYELRDKAGALFGQGDGETFQIYNAQKKEYVNLTLTDYPDLLEQALVKSQSQNGWSVVLTLRFILPEIKGVFGLWQLTTKGEASSIPSIVGAFDSVQEHAGTVVGVPFDLQVEKVKSQKPDSKAKFPVIRLIPNIGESNMRKLKEYTMQGADIKSIGMLTDEKIMQLEAKNENN